jgi:nitrite reductase/ring-hydroxylating ferredoxin subunit
MPQVHTVAKVTQVPEGSSICVEAGGEQIALFNMKGTYFAISESCPHAGGPLSEGFVDENMVVTCPWHGWCFDLHQEKPSNDGVVRYKVLVEDGDIKVEIP